MSRMYLKINTENEKTAFDTKQDNKLHLIPTRRNKWHLCLVWFSVAAIVVVTVVSVGQIVAGENDLDGRIYEGGVEIESESYFRGEHEKGAVGKREGSAGVVLACYYTTSDVLRPSKIHPQLCTHINVAFAQVENKQIKLDDDQIRIISEVVKLKTINPALKVLLSVGGAGDSDGFSQMIVDHASRKTFIRSIKYVLRNYSLDGIDLDWEFPAVHYFDLYRWQAKRERQHFSQLLHEIRKEYIREKRDYLLTVAVAAPQSIVDVAYDIDQINQYADFVNIMTYDFHFFNKFTPFTGLNSPLYARPSEELYFASLNINYTVNMYISKGLSKEKIVVGIPTYGHTFTLVNSDNTNIGSPASGFGSLGSQGFVNYPDICVFIKNATNNVVVKEDNAARVPYLYGGKEWVSYDSPQSVSEKAMFIRNNNLRGAMIFSLNADDYQGICKEIVGSDIKFPLAHSVKKLLIDSEIKDQDHHKALERNENNYTFLERVKTFISISLS